MSGMGDGCDEPVSGVCGAVIGTGNSPDLSRRAAGDDRDLPAHGVAVPARLPGCIAAQGQIQAVGRELPEDEKRS